MTAKKKDQTKHSSVQRVFHRAPKDPIYSDSAFTKVLIMKRSPLQLFCCPSKLILI